MADANIFRQYLQAPKSVADYGADMDKAESNQIALAASRLTNQQAQQGMADDQVMRQAYQQSGGDQNKLMQLLQTGGNYKGVQALQKNMLDSQKLKDDSAKTQADVLDKTLGSFRSFVPQISSPEAAGQYAAAMYDHPVLGKFATNLGTRDEVIKRNMDSFAKDPRAWMVGSAGVTADKLLESFKGTRQNINLGNVSQGTTTNYYGELVPGQTTSTPIGQSADSVASNATTQRGQNMTAGTAAAGRAQSAEQFKITSGQQGKGHYDAERGVMVTPAGVATPVTMGGVPLGAKDTKPTADYLKQAEAYQNMDDALTGYKSALKDFGSFDAMRPDKRAAMGTAYQNVLLQAKEIYKLGVLNGGDERILKAIINSPLDITSLATSKDALNKQAVDLGEIIKRGNANLAKINRQQATPLNSTQPATGGGSAVNFGDLK